MRIRMTLAAASLAALAACGSHNSANNVEANADYNAALPDLNTLEMNATTEMNATGGTDLNAAGTGATGTTNAGNTTTNATTNY
jgi:uncharacterized lipoprotein